MEAEEVGGLSARSGVGDELVAEVGCQPDYGSLINCLGEDLRN